MFSEYASRFLPNQQSQSAPLFNNTDINHYEDDFSDDSDELDYESSSTESVTSGGPPPNFLVENASIDSTYPEDDPPHDEINTETVPSKASIIDQMIVASYTILLVFVTATIALDVLSDSNNSNQLFQIISASSNYLIFSALLSLFIALGWLYLLKFFVHKAIKVAVYVTPAVLVLTTVYTLPSPHTHSLLLKACALIPAAIGILWAKYFKNIQQIGDEVANYICCCSLVLREGASSLLMISVTSGLLSILLSTVWVLGISHTSFNSYPRLAFAVLLTFTYLWTLGILSAFNKVVVSLITSRWCSCVNTQGALNMSIQEVYTYHLANIIVFPLLRKSKSQFLLSKLTVFKRLNELSLPLASVSRDSVRNSSFKLNHHDFRASLESHSMSKLVLMSSQLVAVSVSTFICWVHADRLSVYSYSFVAALITFAVSWTVTGSVNTVPNVMCDVFLVNYEFKRSSIKRDEVKDIFRPSA